MVVDREVEPKTDDVSNDHGSVTQGESTETLFANNPSDLFSVREMSVHRDLGSALQQVKEEGYRGIHTIMIKINKFGSGFNQIGGILTIQLSPLRRAPSYYDSS